MADETAMEDLSKEIENSQNAGNEAYVNFNLTSNVVQTKTDLPIDDSFGQEVASCSVILYKGNQILAAKDGVKVANNKLQNADGSDFSILTKVSTGLNIMIIGNATATYANLVDMNAVKTNIEKDQLNDNTKLVKVGTKELTWKADSQNPNFKASTSTAKTTENTYTATVELQQLAACINLNQISVSNLSGKRDDVTITKIEFLNINTKTYVSGEYAGNDGLVASTIVTPASPIKIYDKTSGSMNATASLPAYSYQNTKGNLAMCIYYTIGTKEYSTKNPITINHSPEGGVAKYVNSGYIYNLNVSLKIENDKADVNVECIVADWIYKNDADHNLSGDLVKK